MVKFERKRTYSRIVALIFFVSTSFLATIVILNNTDSSFYQAGLIGGQFSQDNSAFFSVNKNNVMWWSVAILFLTLVGFFCGRLIDIRRSEYIKINSRYNQ